MNGTLNDIDLSRTLILSGLPSALLEDSAEDFMETIYELMKITFNIERDAIDHMIRSTRSDAKEDETGCKCLISFRTQILRHRVIAQKSKLEPPTVISSVTKIPNDLLQNNEHVLEVADEWIDEDGIQEKNIGQTSKDVIATVKGENSWETCRSDGNDDIFVLQDENISMPEILELENAERVTNDGEKYGRKKYGNRIDIDTSEGDDTFEPAPLSPIDKYQTSHYAKLRIIWDGAPEFQWRIVDEDSEKQLLKIENLIPSDVHNPWIYPAILSAVRMEFKFPKLSFNDVGNFTFGSIDLYFPDGKTLVSSALNYLVYMRLSPGRRAKIYLPYTKAVMKYGRSLEKRLGRARSPTSEMCQLLIKPVPTEITADKFRNELFPHHSIVEIEFRHDSLKQRCAILTFSSAQQAIAAHSFANYVVFKDNEGGKSIGSVLYPSVAVPNWESGDLLVATEMKKPDESSSISKRKESEVEKKIDLTPAKNMEQTESTEKSEKNPVKKTDKGLHEVKRSKPLAKQTVKRPQTNSIVERSSKISRTGNYPDRGSSFETRSLYPATALSKWRTTSSIPPLLPSHSKNTSSEFSRSLNDPRYNTPFMPCEPIRRPEEPFSRELMKEPKYHSFRSPYESSRRSEKPFSTGLVNESRYYNPRRPYGSSWLSEEAFSEGLSRSVNDTHKLYEVKRRPEETFITGSSASVNNSRYSTSLLTYESDLHSKGSINKGRLLRIQIKTVIDKTGQSRQFSVNPLCFEDGFRPYQSPKYEQAVPVGFNFGHDEITAKRPSISTGSFDVRESLNHTYREETFCAELGRDERMREKRGTLPLGDQFVRQQMFINKPVAGHFHEQMTGGYVGSFDTHPHTMEYGHSEYNDSRARWYTHGVSSTYQNQPNHPW